MNIMLINHYAGSSKYGMEFRPYYLAKEWVEFGHNVNIIAGSYSHLRRVNPDFKGNVNKEEIDGINYFWMKTPKYKKNGVKRFLNMFTFLFQVIRNKKTFIKSNPDIVIASSTYPLDIFPAYLIAKRTGAKLIFEVHDLWPLTPIEVGGMSRFHPFIMLLQFAENFACRKSDFVVSLLPKADRYLVDHGMLPSKFYHLPNGINLEEWNNPTVIPDEHEKIISELRKQGKFIIGYAGSHGLANALEYLVEAAKLIKDKQEIAFVLVGEGPEKELLKQKVIKNKMNNIFFLSQVPKRSIPNLLKKMDALFIGWKRVSLYRFGVSPNKLLDYMMSGKPIIHSIEAANDLVAESGCGISVAPENPVEIVEAINKLINMDRVKQEEMGLKGKEYVLQNHDYKVLAKEFVNLVNGEE